MEIEGKQCKNCGTKVSAAYCPECGQRTRIDKVTFAETFHDFVETVFSVDAPLLVTLRMLFTAPGRLFREYLGGKRKTYYRPVAFFILFSVVYLFVRALIDFDPFQNSTIEVTDETKKQLLLGARNYMLSHIDKFLFVFAFTLGLFLKLFFYKSYRLAEYIAIAFYLIGFYTIVTTLNMLFIQYVTPKFQYLAIVVMHGYFCYAMLSFFRQKKYKVWVFIKSLLLFFVSMMTYAFSAFAISFLIVWLKSSS